MATVHPLHRVIANCPAFVADLFHEHFISYDTKFIYALASIVLFDCGEKAQDEFSTIDIAGQLARLDLFYGFKELCAGLFDPKRGYFPALIWHFLYKKFIVVQMLIPFVAKFAKVRARAHQTLID